MTLAWKRPVSTRPVTKQTDSKGVTTAQGTIPRAAQPSLPQWYSEIARDNRTNIYSNREPKPQGETRENVIALPETKGMQQQNKSAAGAGGGAAMDPYTAQANALYEQLINRGQFRYDLQGDMLYRQYADQYSQLGKQAMMDTMGTASALTGGYGNSYAQGVGNQAYQYYLTQLNSMIPEFYDRAYQVWLNEGDDLLQKYKLAQSKANAARASRAQAPAQVQEAEAAEPEYWSTGAIPQNATLTPDTMQALIDNILLDYNLYGYYQ